MDTTRQPKRQPRFPKSHPTKVAEALRERIRSGQYQPGEPLPSGRALEEDLNVDRRVVRVAIETLKGEGILGQRPNCRPYVALPAQSELRNNTSSAATLPASRLIALIMWHGGATDSFGTVQQRVFWGMIEVLGPAGYHAVFLDVGPDFKSDLPKYEREAKRLSYALNCGFGGVVYFPQAYDHNRELMREVSKRVPLVLLDRLVPGVQADFVGAENRKSMFDATSYLIEQGHSRIAFVTAGEWINTVQDRVRGYLDAVHQAFPSNAYEMVLTPPFTKTNQWPEFDAVARLPAHERPTAFVCVNNNEAVRVARRLSEHNLSVPEDASVIGFDNVQQTLPNGVGLTTIAQPFEAIGRQAAKLLLQRLQNPSSAFTHVELPTNLILHDSVRKVG